MGQPKSIATEKNRVITRVRYHKLKHKKNFFLCLCLCLVHKWQQGEKHKQIRSVYMRCSTD